MCLLTRWLEKYFCPNGSETCIHTPCRQAGRQKGQTDRHKSSGIFQFKESLKHCYNAYFVLSDIAV